jgi:phospholipase/carboxylesterase
MTVEIETQLGSLLAGINSLMAVQRYLNPVLIDQLKEKVSARLAPLENARRLTAESEWPDGTEAIRQSIDTSFELTQKAITAFVDTPDDPDGIFMAYRALRYTPYAVETLYPAASLFPSVSGFFMEEQIQNDVGLLAHISGAVPREDTGVLHFSNERNEKGGCSIYIPEYYSSEVAYPVVVALHGGSGHGRAFLWTWLKEARSRGFIVISPTARGDTWSLMQPEVDDENIETILDATRQRWNVDGEHLLMTGMSDGGTFTYMSGLKAASPFTHLAPISASFHVMMLEILGPTNIDSRPIYLTHGAQDWMFEIDVARVAHQVLEERGADIVYREIADLSHAYPRDENPKILDWFLG